MRQLAVIFLMSLLLSQNALADCTSPAGVQGQFKFQTNDFIFCDGSTWTSLVGIANSGITALSGDVTGTGSGSVSTTIANDAVSFTKMQNIATDTLVGRGTAGSGDPESITVGTGLSIDGSNNLLVADPLDLDAMVMDSLKIDNGSGAQIELITPVAFTSYQLTLPDSDGNSGEVLTTNGTGVLTWAAPSGADNMGNHTASQNIVLGSNYLSGDGGNEGIAVDSAGKVGIGTLAPSHMLHIRSTGDASLYLEADTDNSNEADGPLLKMSQDNGSNYFGLGMVGVPGQDPEGNTLANTLDNSVLFYTNDRPMQFADGEVIMTLDDTAVGIGTSTPQNDYAPLTIGSDHGCSYPSNYTPYRSVLIGGYGCDFRVPGNAYVYLTNSDTSSGGTVLSQARDDFFISQIQGSNYYERFVIDSDGFIGIGTRYPNGAFHVRAREATSSGGDNDIATFYAEDVATNTDIKVTMGKDATYDNRAYWLFHYDGDGSANNYHAFGYDFDEDQLVMKPNGHIGINTISPDDYLVVNNGSTIGRYTSSGWTHSSDRRLKRDIQSIDDSLLKILNLEGVSYIYNKDEDNTKQLGLIAQDVQPYFPEAVREDDQGFLSISYGALVAPLVESIKSIYVELQGKADRSEIELLKKENEELKRRLEAIEKKLK